MIYTSLLLWRQYTVYKHTCLEVLMLFIHLFTSKSAENLMQTLPNARENKYLRNITLKYIAENDVAIIVIGTI